MADTTTWTPISAPTDFQDDAVFNIDFKTKTVQVLVEQPIVAGENLSQFIKFQAPRFYDAIDLTEMMVNILYVSPAGNKGISAAVNTEYSDDMIRCGWLVPYAACPQKGTLHFVLEFVGADYTLKTTIANTPVLDSINDEDVVPEPAEQAWYIALQDNVSVTLQAAQTALGRIESIFNALSTPSVASEASEMFDEDTIYVYTGSETGYTYGDWYYYDGEDWVSGGEYASTALIVDATLSKEGQAADAKAVGDEVTALKQDIINGRVSVNAGTEEVLPSASGFQVARITPKNGNVTANRETYLVVNGTNTTYYPLISTDFLSDDIKAIQSSYSSVKFILFAYDKTTSEYLGAIFQEYTFKSKEDLETNNNLFPYSGVDMDVLKESYPNYKYKLEITDTAVNHDTLPSVSDAPEWCTYTVPRATSQRQLVKTVNGTAPDSDGNIELDFADYIDEVPTAGSEKAVQSGGVKEAIEEVKAETEQIRGTVLYTLLDFGHAGSYINTSGQIVSASDVWGYTDTYYAVNPSTEYFLKITDAVFVAEYASDKSFIKCASVTVATAKFTTTATTAYIRISAKTPDWIPLIVSTTAFFGNYDMSLINDVIERKTGGIDAGEIDKIKNATVLTLFGFGHQGYYINTSGNVVSTNQTWGYTEDYYPVNPATEYFLKTTDIVFIAEYTSDKTFIKCASIAASVAKFTSTANTAYVRIDAKVTDWATFAMSTTSFFGNYDTTYIDSAIDRKTGAITKGNLYGKKIVFFGDSITGNYKPPADYPSFLAQATGATVYNAGFGGTCMCDNGETKGIFSFCRLIDAIVDGDWTAQDNSGFVRNYFDDETVENYVPAKIAMLKAINWSEIDYVMTNHGTNDWGSGYTIDNANNLYDTTTYAGAFRYAFEKLQTAYPNIKIIPITPLTRISHEGSVYYDSNEYDRNTGQYLYQFANKIIDVAENKYFTRPCDLYHSCMITKWNHTRYLRDGIHPTTTGGQEWVAQLIVAFFNSYI